MASCSGIRPDNLLELRKRNWRERPRRPSSGGMGPERELEGEVKEAERGEGAERRGDGAGDVGGGEVEELERGERGEL